MSAKPSAQYDIFPKMAPFLDPHLMFPVLSFLAGLDIYDAKDLAAAQLDLAKRTKMSDYAVDCYRQLKGDENAPIPKDLEDMKAQVEAEWHQHMKAVEPFMALIEVNAEAGTVIPTQEGADLIDARCFTPEHLQEHYGITAETIEALYKWAKFRYECGEYDLAADLLRFYRELVPLESEQGLRALWGKMVADIVATRFEDADKDREELKAAISRGGSNLTELQSLQHRSWLLHWSLFVFANLPKGGKEFLLEFFLADSSLNAITLNCPWLLRYLAAAVLTSKKRHVYTRQLLRVVTASGLNSEEDPIIEFVVALLSRFDFEAAQATLSKCSSVIATDFFLSFLTSETEFMESARRLLFETYCRIHQKIGLDTLASKLHLSETDAEKWLVDLIQTAGLGPDGGGAKIDSTEKQVVMSVPRPSVYQQVIDKTRELTLRTRLLADSVEAEKESQEERKQGGAAGAAGAAAAGGSGGGDQRREGGGGGGGGGRYRGNY